MRHTNKDLTKKVSEFKYGMSFKELACLTLITSMIIVFWSFVLKGFNNQIKFSFILASILLHTFFYLPLGKNKVYKWFYKWIVFVFSKKKYTSKETTDFIPYQNIINGNVLMTNGATKNKYLKIIQFKGYDVWTQNEIDIEKKLRDINFVFENINLDFEIVKTNSKNDLNFNLEHLAEEIDKRSQLNKDQINYYENLVEDISKEHNEVEVENYYLVLKSNNLQNLELETHNFLSNILNIGINAYELDKLEIIDFIGQINNYVIDAQKLEEFLLQEDIFDYSYKKEEENVVKFNWKEKLQITLIHMFKSKALAKCNLNAINTLEELQLYKDINAKLTFIDMVLKLFNKEKLKELANQIEVNREAALKLIPQKNDKKMIYLDEIYKQKEFTLKSKHIKYNDGTYQTFLNVQSLPFNLPRAYLRDLLSTNGTSFFKLDKMGDEKTNAVIDFAKKKTENIEFNKKASVNTLNNTYISVLEEVLDIIVNQDKSLYTFNTFIEVRANTLSELKSKVRQIKMKARNHRIKVEVPTFNILESFLSNKLMNTLYKDNNKTILIDNFIQGWYFLQNSFNDYNNLFVGKGINDEYIFFDRFRKSGERTNANMFITGTSGAGKSTFAEKMILNDLANNRDVIVLDLQQEYKANGLKMNATILDFADNQKPLAINVLQIRELFSAEKSDKKIPNNIKINSHLIYLEKFFNLVFRGDISSNLMNYLIKCIKELYEECGYYDNNLDLETIKNQEWITINDLIIKIENYQFETDWERINFQEHLKHLAHQLKLIFHTENTLSLLFNRHTNFDIDSQYTIFDLHTIINTSESADGYYSQIVLFVLLNFLQDKIAKNRENKKQLSLFIGETHFFVQSQNKVLFDFLFFTIKTARKYGLSVVLDTQNLSDFYREKENSNALLSNCDYSLFLRQKSSEIEEINEKLFSRNKALTETEKEFLERASVGQGVLNIGSKLRYLIKIHYNEYEQEVLFKSKGEYI